MNTKVMQMFFMITTFALLVVPARATTENNLVVDTRYEILMDKELVGTVVQSRTRTNDGADRLYIIESEIELEVRWMFGKYTLSEVSQVTIENTGKVRSFDHKITENKKVYWLSGERYENELWVQALRIRTQPEKETKALSDTAVGVVASGVPAVGIATSLLSGEEDEGAARIPLSEFDATIDQLPWIISEPADLSAQLSVRLLDSETFEVESAVVTIEGVETLLTSGQSLPCRIATVQSDGHKRTLWISTDVVGPFIVKQIGKDSDGDYEFALSSYEVSE